MDGPRECAGCHRTWLFDTEDEFNAHEAACLAGAVRVGGGEAASISAPAVPPLQQFSTHHYSTSSPSTTELNRIADAQFAQRWEEAENRRREEEEFRARAWEDQQELARAVKREAVLKYIMDHHGLEGGAGLENGDPGVSSTHGTTNAPNPSGPEPPTQSATSSNPADPANSTFLAPDQVASRFMTWNLLLLILAIVCFLLAAFGAAIGSVNLVAIGLAFFAAAHIGGSDSRIG